MGGKVLVTRRRKAEISEDDERLKYLKNLKVKGGMRECGSIWGSKKDREASGESLSKVPH